MLADGDESRAYAFPLAPLLEVVAGLDQEEWALSEEAIGAWHLRRSRG